jgi:hypothetical protein
MVRQELYVRHPSGPNPRGQPQPYRVFKNNAQAAPTPRVGRHLSIGIFRNKQQPRQRGKNDLRASGEWAAVFSALRE